MKETIFFVASNWVYNIEYYQFQMSIIVVFLNFSFLFRDANKPHRPRQPQDLCNRESLTGIREELLQHCYSGFLLSFILANAESDEAPKTNLVSFQPVA